LIDAHGLEWKISDTPIAYPEALAWMETRAAGIARRDESECVWLLEHPPLYTAGTSADPAELLTARFPVFVAGRGGRYTYHGPGQRIAYLMLNLDTRGRDVRAFVAAVEGWMIAALDRIGVVAWRAPGRIGIWTDYDGREAKIGAIGIRVRRWVSMHGFSINVAPDLSHFDGIVPCGLPEFAVTSLEQLGVAVPMAALDDAIRATSSVFIDSVSRAQTA
jgi:lipoyl(octanoyl) transferase